MDKMGAHMDHIVQVRAKMNKVWAQMDQTWAHVKKVGAQMDQIGAQVHQAGAWLAQFGFVTWRMRQHYSILATTGIFEPQLHLYQPWFCQDEPNPLF